MAEPTLDDWLAAGAPETLEWDGQRYCHSCFSFDAIGICGCGKPGEVAALIYRMLHALGQEDREWDAPRKAAGDPPGTVYELLLHWIEDHGWTEHGGSTYGSWLTDDGRKAMAAARALVRIELGEDAADALDAKSALSVK